MIIIDDGSKIDARETVVGAVCVVLANVRGWVELQLLNSLALRVFL